MNHSESIGVGVIGCGTIAYWAHLRNLAKMPQVRLVGLADPDPQALKRATTRIQASTYNSAASLLGAQGLDAVIIASPTALHAEQLLAACTASKHVYLEKPMAIDKPSAVRAAAAVHGAGIQFAVGFNRRFHPLCQRARQLLQSGLIGAVRTVISSFSEPESEMEMPQWKRKRSTGGGVLLDLGIHHLDLYRWFLDDELAEIRAQIDSVSNEQDTVLAQILTQGGIRINGHYSFNSSRSDYLEFHGERGILRVDLHQGSLDLRQVRSRGYGVSRRRLPAPIAQWPWKMRKLVRPSYDPSHGRGLQAFIEAATSSEPANVDLAGVNDGLCSVQAVLAAEESAIRNDSIVLNRD